MLSPPSLTIAAARFGMAATTFLTNFAGRFIAVRHPLVELLHTSWCVDMFDGSGSGPSEARMICELFFRRHVYFLGSGVGEIKDTL